jgi:cation diffusion facilitator CzcD-associated flavoprotein CzcO
MGADYRVLIIGAGFGGIGLGARLLESGEKSFLILE